MRKFLGHLKTYVFRGFWSVIPITLSGLVIHFLYVQVDRRIATLIERALGFSLPGLGVLLLILLLYFLGLVASNVLGKKVFDILERLTHRIPLIRTTYQVGKQLAATFSVPGKEVFKRAVLVPYLKPGMWTVGFVTGTMLDRHEDGETFLKVYIPTPPNPTSGTMVLVKESEVRDPGWTVEEAMKVIISAGIIGPREFA